MFAAHPALVLNADFQPLSYLPLSLLNWENAIKAVVKGTHYVVEEHDAMKPLRAPVEPTPHELTAAKKAFPPNFLHESWADYLYWDGELSA